jgi:hypothetical protein
MRGFDRLGSLLLGQQVGPVRQREGDGLSLSFGTVSVAGPSESDKTIGCDGGSSSARARSSRARSRSLRATSSWVRTVAKFTSLRVWSMIGLTPAAVSFFAWSSSSAAILLSAKRAVTASSALNTCKYARPASAAERSPTARAS